MNNLKNFLIFIVFEAVISNYAMHDNLDEESQLKQFFEVWEGNEYHAKKFVDDSKHSGKPQIEYHKDRILIAIYNKKTKMVTTYLPSGEYHVPYKKFKKLMQLKMCIDKKYTMSKSSIIVPLARSLLK